MLKPDKDSGFQTEGQKFKVRLPCLPGHQSVFRSPREQAEPEEK